MTDFQLRALSTEDPAQIRQVLEEMRESYEAEIQRLTNAASAQLNMANAAAAGRGPRYNQPDEFHGERKKVQTFVAAVELSFLAEPQYFHNEMQRVIYAIKFLKGAAAEWLRPYQRRGILESFPTYDAFRNELLQSFGDPNEKRTAERELTALRQTGTCGSYTTDFLCISSVLGWNDEALRSHYRRGLKPEIQDQLVFRDTGTTLRELTEVAKVIDGHVFTRKLEKSQSERVAFNPNRNYTTHRPVRTNREYIPIVRTNVPTPARGGGAIPMEIDATSQRYQPMSDKKKEQMKSGKCFNCDGTGHLARECPKSKN